MQPKVADGEVRDGRIGGDVVIAANGAGDANEVRVVGQDTVSINIIVLESDGAGIRTFEAGRVEGDQIVAVGGRGVGEEDGRAAIGDDGVIDNERAARSGRRRCVHQRETTAAVGPIGGDDVIDDDGAADRKINRLAIIMPAASPIAPRAVFW